MDTSLEYLMRAWEMVESSASRMDKKKVDSMAGMWVAVMARSKACLTKMNLVVEKVGLMEAKWAHLRV